MQDLPLLKFFEQAKLPFTSLEEALVEKYFSQESFKKNEIILNAGEVCKKIYFVKKGLIRTFHANVNGTEFTRLFAKENDFCTILISFTEKIGSPATIQSLEDTDVFTIKKSDFLEFTKISQCARDIYTKILEDYQNFQIGRLEFLTTHSPKEKVQKFLAENSDLEKRISDKIIATYLQITPETYSRCKKHFKV